MATMQERALEELDARYEIRNAREVSRYLAEYPELEPFLIEAHQQIGKVFGESSKVSLEYWKDIEEESHVALLVYISSKLEDTEASDKLDLISQWSAKAKPRSSGRIILEMDFA